MTKLIRRYGRVLLVYFRAQLIRQVSSRGVATSATDCFRRMRRASSTFFVRYESGSTRIKCTTIGINGLYTRFDRLIRFIRILTYRRIRSIRINFIQECLRKILYLLRKSSDFMSNAFTFLGPLSRKIRINKRVCNDERSALIFLAFKFAVGLLPPFTCMIRFKVMICRSFGFLAILMRLIAHDYVSNDEVFYGQGVFSADLFRNGYAYGRFLGIRAYCYSKRRTCQDRCKRASTRIVKSSRKFMTFIINHCTNDTLFNVNSNGSGLLYRVLTTLIFTLLFRRARHRNHFDNDAKFKSISGARFLIFRMFNRFV